VPKLSQVIQIDEGKIQEHLGEVVRSTVEETLTAMLDAEAALLCFPTPAARSVVEFVFCSNIQRS